MSNLLHELFPDLTPEEIALFESAPVGLLAIDGNIDMSSGLSFDDKRFVDTRHARGSHFRDTFFARLGYKSGVLRPKTKQHLLFIGHVGCGKSSELTHLSAELHAPDLYWVVRTDVNDLLDINDLKYYDVWLAFAKEIIDAINQHNQNQPQQPITIPEAEYGKLRDWLTTLVHEEVDLKELTAHVETAAQLGGMLPYLGGLLAKLTSGIKAGKTYRDILRKELNKTYSEFVSALNTFLAAVNNAVREAKQGQGLLLVVDGLDRLQRADWHEFFVGNVNQLVSVNINAVYTAPMALKASGETPKLFQQIVMPMVKLKNFDTGEDFIPGYQALRRLVLLRANYRAFASAAALDKLIEYSGGHLRDLLSLLSAACIEADDILIDLPAVDWAIKSVATGFRDWLKPKDYVLLKQIDQQPVNHGLEEDMSHLIDRGALLEYNEGSWRQSHPCIRTLAGYKHAQATG